MIHRLKSTSLLVITFRNFLWSLIYHRIFITFSSKLICPFTPKTSKIIFSLNQDLPILSALNVFFLICINKFVNYLKNKKEHLFLDLFVVLSFFVFIFLNKELEYLFSGLATVRVLDLFLDSQLFQKLKKSILYKNGQNLFHTNGLAVVEPVHLVAEHLHCVRFRMRTLGT